MRTTMMISSRSERLVSMMSVRTSAVSAITASYLLGIPQLGDFLEEGLSMLGYSCEDYEIGRL